MPDLLGADMAIELHKIKGEKNIRIILISADYVYGVEDYVDSMLLKPLDMGKIHDI